ncbi:hypothetical protein MKX03_017628 [Papaver bracteatum]|nr:hypothetical protein MKX03_017628 [Papaver bracteatum]
MGFSSEQAALNGFDWTQNLLQSSGLEFSNNNPSLIQQQQQQFAQPLNCPRCDSTNTKFCYYNNYNRTQPRHYCKSCKRHWTKGGTLRNVPVGGARKNKRQKIDNNSSSNKSKNNSNKKRRVVTDCSERKGNNMVLQSSGLEQDTTSEFLYESLIYPTSTTATARQQNFFSVENSNIGDGNSFMSSSSIDPGPIPMFQFASLSSIDHNHQQHNPSLNSSTTLSNGGFQSSSTNGFNYSGDSASVESSSPWQAPSTNNFMNSSSINWSWEDLNTLV